MLYTYEGLAGSCNTLGSSQREAQVNTATASVNSSTGFSGYEPLFQFKYRVQLNLLIED